jgi:glycosyltransferase involved in cell wall biosynthesis
MLISIIIITLNEAKNLMDTFKSIKRASSIKDNIYLPIETIVSDGGSTDCTVEIAEMYADHVVIGRKGRYKQLNNGAMIANGDILVFLHADTKLSRGSLLRLYKRMKNPKYVGGFFKKVWGWSTNKNISALLKLANFFWESSGNWLAEFFKLFPGDNAIYVRKQVFDELKGYNPLWICEDFDFSKRMKDKYGKKRIAYVKEPVITSTRRFLTSGFLKVIFLWCVVYFLWRFGMGSDRLKVFLAEHPIGY